MGSRIQLSERQKMILEALPKNSPDEKGMTVYTLYKVLGVSKRSERREISRDLVDLIAWGKVQSRKTGRTLSYVRV